MSPLVPWGAGERRACGCTKGRCRQRQGEFANGSQEERGKVRKSERSQGGTRPLSSVLKGCLGTKGWLVGLWSMTGRTPSENWRHREKHSFRGNKTKQAPLPREECVEEEGQQANLSLFKNTYFY